MIQPLRIQFLQSASNYSTLPALDLPELCIVGRSNVGKSSLINALSGRKQLARVSSTPGQTRLLNLFQVHEPAMTLMDLPGYGYAEVSRSEQKGWLPMMTSYFENRRNLVGFLFLMDVRRTPNEDDCQLFEWLSSRNLKPLVVVTKAEKIHKSQFVAVRKEIAPRLKVSPDAIVFTSAMKKMGFESLQVALQGILFSPVEEE